MCRFYLGSFVAWGVIITSLGDPTSATDGLLTYHRGVVLKHDVSAYKHPVSTVYDGRLWEQATASLLASVVDQPACTENDRLPANTKVVVSVDQHVWALFVNWLSFYLSEGCGNALNLHLICTDAQTRTEIRSMGLICSTLAVFHGKFQATMIWHTRFRVVCNLLVRGYDVIVSDVDAVWLSPVAPHVNNLQDNTVVAAMRCENPQDLKKKWGAALNFGFVYLRSMEMATIVRERLRSASYTNELLNDQLVLNEILSTEDLQVEKNVSGVTHGTETEYGNFPATSQLRGKAVGFLPPEQFPRHQCAELPSMDNVAVLHCASSYATVKRRRGYNSTQDTLQQYGAWRDISLF